MLHETAARVRLFRLLVEHLTCQTKVVALFDKLQKVKQESE